jgi:hypothetical protein
MKMFVIHYRKKDWWVKLPSDHKQGVIFENKAIQVVEEITEENDVIFANDEDQVFQIFEEEYNDSELIGIYKCTEVYP